MPDFEITEVQSIHYNSNGFSKGYSLGAGHKLSDDTALVAIANKTVPAGYIVNVSVEIKIIGIEKL